MANTALLADLRTSCLQRSDLATSAFVGRWEANDWINEALSELHDLIVKAYKQHYFKTTTLTLVAGTEAYNLPTDFGQMLAVYWLSGGYRYPLREVMLPEYPERQLPLAMVVGIDIVTMMWRTLGTQMYFVPKPLAGGSVELWYTPQFVPLVDPLLNDGSTPNPNYSAGQDAIEPQVFPGWQAYVMADFGIKAALKQELDPSPWMALKTAQAKRVEQMAQQRNTGTPQRLYDAYGPSRGWGRRRRRFP